MNELLDATNMINNNMSSSPSHLILFSSLTIEETDPFTDIELPTVNVVRDWNLPIFVHFSSFFIILR